MSDFKGKIAAHAITWGDDHLKAVEEISQLGYRAIEPWASFVLQYENRIDTFKEWLAGYGLVLTGLYGGASGGANQRFADPGVRRELVDHNVRLAKTIRQCGADILVLGPGGTREHPTTPDELKNAAVTINEIAKATYDLGVKACIHPHLWTEVQDEHELVALMEQLAPEVYFAPDTAHLLGAGMDPAAIIRRYKDRVAYVHMKDLTVQNQASAEELPFFCELGQGAVDFAGVIEALNDIRYTGWVTVEVDRSLNTPYRSLEICRHYIEQQLQIPIK
ncbi:sugar phosphate isomerase/epimerase family protein [Paenibacillus pinihumi]|uniref:sugar phosphate isomerase/epimerase family protein n=1 Tax=Paenibacillus pinihumi TaxID=669462 RepID=UPI00041C226E|nr:sugar phosphate isomerase/epimerase [Paenibacillus pinihumi]